ncbi:MAG: DUF952 domain-containing protein, partial [Balneolaceae bacterium]
MKHDLIFHFVSQHTWKNSMVNGAYHPESLKDENKGTIPCCNPPQVECVANDKFSGKDHIYLIVIDANRVSTEITISEFDGQEYPQINGPLNMDAVIDKITLEPEEDGSFEINIDIL